MLKKILKFFTTALLGILIGLCVWLIAFNGIEKLQLYVAFPDEPQGLYSGFYYSRLNDKEKVAYEVIMEEIKDMPKKIRVPELDKESLSNVFDALHYDNTDLFFLGDNCVVETSFSANYFVPEYIMGKTEYEKCMEELMQEKDKIIKTVSTFSDDYEKELYIHDYIVDKCQYVDEVGGSYSSMYGCIVKGEASCEGYAKAMKYLLDEAGIENYIASGYTYSEGNSESEGHAWNIVNINSHYYHVDVTWDDPIISEVEKKYAYFNISDNEISKTHEVDGKFMGVCTSEKENYYEKNGLVFLVYDGKTRDTLTSELAHCLASGGKVFSFKFKDEKTLNEAKEALFDMNGIYSILLSASSTAGKRVSQDGISYAIDEKHFIIIISDFI